MVSRHLAAKLSLKIFVLEGGQHNDTDLLRRSGGTLSIAQYSDVHDCVDSCHRTCPFYSGPFTVVLTANDSIYYFIRSDL